VLRIGLWRAWIVFTRRPWAFSISAGLLLAQLLVSGKAAYWLVLALAITATGKELVDIAMKVFDHFKEVKAAKPVFRAEPVLLPYKSPYDRWAKFAADGCEAVHDPELDAELAADARIAFDAKPEMWRPTGKHEEVRALTVSTLAFDEDKVRLGSDLFAGTERVQVQRTSYSAFLVTNRLATCEFREKDSLHELIEFPDGPAAGHTELPRLEWSTARTTSASTCSPSPAASCSCSGRRAGTSCRRTCSPGPAAARPIGLISRLAVAGARSGAAPGREAPICSRSSSTPCGAKWSRRWGFPRPSSTSRETSRSSGTAGSLRSAANRSSTGSLRSAG
jgi:hypothetical protein